MAQDDDSLWGLAPDEFVAARDALARRLRSEGRVDEAAAVKALRKPTLDAWVVNQLVRSRPGTVDEVIALGEELRAAQEHGDAQALRGLASRRDAVLDAATAVAAGVVDRLSDTTRDAVRRTLGAALADPDAAELVRAGRLSHGLEYAGLGVAPVSVTRGEPTPPSAAVTPRRSTPLRAVPDRDDSRLRAAEQAVRDAEDEVTAAQLARAEAQERVDELAAELDEAKAALNEAQVEARAAARARDAAAATLSRLQRRHT